MQNYTTMSICYGTGVELDLLTQGLSLLGLYNNVNYTIECVPDLDTIKSRVLTEPAIGIGGIQINKDDLLSGYYFTHPTYYSGLNVLIKNLNFDNPYSIFNAFQLEVWILYITAPLVLGIVSWVYSIIIHQNSLRSFSYLYDFIWESYRAWMFSSKLSPKSPGRLSETVLSIFMYLFFLVLVACFTSNIYQKLTNFISKFGDLAGQIVLVEPAYEDVCGQYSIYYYTFLQDFYQNFTTALELLNNEKYLGIIAETTFLLNNTYGNTDFTINTYPFITFNFGGIYGPGLSNNIANTINKALAGIESSNYNMETLNKYNLLYHIYPRNSVQITITDCRYLFLSLAIAVFLAFLLSKVPADVFYAEFWNYCFRKKIKYFNELELGRTDIDQYRKSYDLNNISEYMPTINSKDTRINNEKFESSWAIDLPDEFNRIIRTSTLSIMDYEANCLNYLDSLINTIKENNYEKQNIIDEIESYLYK